MMERDNELKHTNNTGFSLIELLTVTAIISIIAGMIGIASHSARQRAYATQARLEAQEVATAFRSYWVAYGRWPTGFDGGYNGALTRSKLFESDLMGAAGSSGKTRSPFLEISEKDFYGSEDYLDPWGNPYRLLIKRTEEVEQAEQFQVVVSFVNAEKHYYDE